MNVHVDIVLCFHTCTVYPMLFCFCFVDNCFVIWLQLSKTMGTVVKGLDKVMATMDLEKV